MLVLLEWLAIDISFRAIPYYHLLRYHLVSVWGVTVTSTISLFSEDITETNPPTRASRHQLQPAEQIPGKDIDCRWGSESAALLGVVLWPNNRPLTTGCLSAQVTLGFALPMGWEVTTTTER